MCICDDARAACWDGKFHTNNIDTMVQCVSCEQCGGKMRWLGNEVTCVYVLRAASKEKDEMLSTDHARSK